MDSCPANGLFLRAGPKVRSLGYLPGADQKCRRKNQSMRRETVISSGDLAQASVDGGPSTSITIQRMPKYGDRIDWSELPDFLIQF